MSKPELHLIIPRLFQPLNVWHNDFSFSADALSLSNLLKQYKVSQSYSGTGLHAGVFASIGCFEGELPIAQYRFQALQNPKTVRNRGGVFENNPKMLLCADPVHLEVGINDITMTDYMDDLSDADAIAIIDALNAHFEQDGIEFIRGSNAQWYLSLPQEEDVATTPLSEALRKNIINFLPESKDRNWKIIQNETQMLLHGLSINQEREMQGLATVNSLWFWGAGQAQDFKHTVTSVMGSEILAAAADCPKQELTENTDFQALSKSAKGKTVVVLDQLMDAALYDDVDRFQQVLTHLDHTIIRPLLSEWNAGKINISIDSCDGKILQPQKAPSWKFWAKPASLLKVARDIKA